MVMRMVMEVWTGMGVSLRPCLCHPGLPRASPIAGSSPACRAACCLPVLTSLGRRAEYRCSAPPVPAARLGPLPRASPHATFSPLRPLEPGRQMEAA